MRFAAFIPQLTFALPTIYWPAIAGSAVAASLFLCAPCAAAQSGFMRADPSAVTVRAGEDVPPVLRRRAKGSRDIAVAADGLYIESAASGLGSITALTTDNDGRIYVLNMAGSIYVLEDRAKDGRIDIKRVIASGMDRPTGLAIAGEALYAADQSAVWRIDIATGERSVFVPLSNIEAQEPRPLLFFNHALVLGLTQGERAKVLSIDMDTRRARLLAEIPSAPLRGLSIGGGQIWAAAGTSLRPLSAHSGAADAPHYPLEAGAQALGLLLPSEEAQYPKSWPKALRSHIIALQGSAGPKGERSSGGNNVVSIPARFGVPGPKLYTLATGFSGQSGQSAWAAPSAIVMDERGLFIADRFGGTVMRLAVDDRPPPSPKTKPRLTPPVPKPAVQKPSHKPNDTPAMFGSSLGEASHLTKGSTLAVGSTLKKSFEDKELSKQDAEILEKERKAKAKSDARDERERKRIEAIKRALKRNAASGN